MASWWPINVVGGLKKQADTFGIGKPASRACPT